MDLSRAVDQRSAYRVLIPHPIRYNDTDRQGHVNNATFATLFEFARTEFFYAIEPGLMAEDCEPVLARLEVDFRLELFYPATVDIAIAVQDVGRSSVRFAQAVFRDDACVASGATVLVQLETKARKTKAWSENQRATLERYRLGAR